MHCISFGENWKKIKKGELVAANYSSEKIWPVEFSAKIFGTKQNDVVWNFSGDIAYHMSPLKIVRY